MATLIEESEEAFRELLEVMPAEIEFNGIAKPCVSHSLNIKRAQQLQHYQLDASQEVEMFVSDFEAFEGIRDRQSEVRVNGGEPLVYLIKDTHPNSATVHLFLGAVQ
jgi:hypothetical protein